MILVKIGLEWCRPHLMTAGSERSAGSYQIIFICLVHHATAPPNSPDGKRHGADRNCAADTDDNTNDHFARVVAQVPAFIFRAAVGPWLTAGTGAGAR